MFYDQKPLARNSSFRLLIAPLFVIVLCLASAGCSGPAGASAGAAPAMNTPVGPVPGYGAPPKTPSDPYATDTTAIAQGRKLFVWYNCYGCHGGHGGGGNGPSLRDSHWMFGSTDAQVFNSIAEGRGKGMPAWGLKIPDQQIWELVAYIKTLRTSHEADPPR